MFNTSISIVARVEVTVVDGLIDPFVRTVNSVVPDIGLPADLDTDMWAIMIAVFEFIISPASLEELLLF